MNVYALLADKLTSIQANRLRASYFIFYGVLVLSISSCFIYLGSIGLPGLHWDASLYGTPVINVANGKGWLFGSFGMQIAQRESFLYDFHGILHVIIYGVIFKSTTWESYIFSQSIVNAITFVSYCSTYLMLLARIYGYNFISLISSLLLGIIPGVICISLQGRPEHLSPLILLLPVLLLYKKVKPIYLFLGFSLTLALLIVSSPLLGIFFASLVVFYWYGSGKKSPLASLRISAFCILFGILISSFLILVLTPFSPFNWYINVVRASKVALNFEGSLLLLKSAKWGFSIIAPFWNSFALLSIIAGIVWLWIQKRNVASILIAFIVFAYFNEKMIDYGYAPLVPFSISLCLLSPKRLTSATKAHPALNAIKLFAVFGACFYLYVLTSYVGLTFAMPSHEWSLTRARQRFFESAAGKALSANASAVGFHGNTIPSFVVFGDANANYVTVDPKHFPALDDSVDKYINILERKSGLNLDYIVYPQTFARVTSPLPPSKLFLGSIQFDLLENNWKPPNAFDLKIRPSNISNRYNYAVYSRK